MNSRVVILAYREKFSFQGVNDLYTFLNIFLILTIKSSLKHTIKNIIYSGIVALYGSK